MDVDVVIVTFNRLEKLKKALASYERQTRSFRNLIVVNNHSSDGTFEYLEAWQCQDAPFSKVVISTDENLGGSGGYFLGQKKAMELKADWVFLADDDAYAEPDMLERFYDYAETADLSRVSAVCGTVFHTDGSIDLNHRSRCLRKGKRFVYRTASTPEDYEKPSFEVDYLSYVGSFINGEAMAQVGTVDASFFIFWDDSEHSLRLKKFGPIVCVPSIRIVHDDMTPVSNQNAEVQPLLVSWKDYYLERNEVVMYKRHFPWAALHQLRMTLKDRVKGKNREDAYAQVKWDAIMDAWLGRMGKHRTYRPGWEIRKSN